MWSPPVTPLLATTLNLLCRFTPFPTFQYYLSIILFFRRESGLIQFTIYYPFLILEYNTQIAYKSRFIFNKSKIIFECNEIKEIPWLVLHFIRILYQRVLSLYILSVPFNIYNIQQKNNKVKSFFTYVPIEWYSRRSSKNNYKKSPLNRA